MTTSTSTDAFTENCALTYDEQGSIVAITLGKYCQVIEPINLKSLDMKDLQGDLSLINELRRENKVTVIEEMLQSPDYIKLGADERIAFRSGYEAYLDTIAEDSIMSDVDAVDMLLMLQKGWETEGLSRFFEIGWGRCEALCCEF